MSRRADTAIELRVALALEMLPEPRRWRVLGRILVMLGCFDTARALERETQPVEGHA